MAYGNSVEPFGGTVEDLRFGTLAALYFNARVGEARRMQPLDFFGWHQPSEPTRVVDVSARPGDIAGQLNALYRREMGDG